MQFVFHVCVFVSMFSLSIILDSVVVQPCAFLFCIHTSIHNHTHTHTGGSMSDGCMSTSRQLYGAITAVCGGACNRGTWACG